MAAKTPTAGGSMVGANESDYTFTASRENMPLKENVEDQEEMNEEQKKFIHFARALAALNTDIFGHSLTLTGEQINEYIHTAASDGRTSLTVPNSLSYQFDPMFKAKTGSTPDTSGSEQKITIVAGSSTQSNKADSIASKVANAKKGRMEKKA